MKKYICLLIFILFKCNIYSQFADRQANFPQISSPNVASFNKFIDHPISLYNGTPDVNIPLYVIKDGTIELPITLRYNTSGIKVNEEASWVGLGWNLNVGGVISQNVLGYCDEEDTEYNDFLNTPEFSAFFNSEPINGYFRLPYNLPIHKKIGAIVTKRAWYSTHGLAKLEPDVFYFSYPGNAGKFIIDYRTNKVYILSREQDVKIDFSVNPRLFTITTTEGIKHTFTRMFDVIRDGIESVSYGLTSSLYPNNQTVLYEYEVVDNRSYMRYENYSNAYYDVNETILPSYVGIDATPYQRETKIYEGKEIILKNIKTTNYEVSFITDSRLDLPQNTFGEKLIEIKIASKDKINKPQNKRFILNYDYFLADNFGDNWGVSFNGEEIEKEWPWKRLKLLGVYELSNDIKSNKYDFFYQESPLLPRKDSYAVDYWGYYNGRWQNKFLIPDLEKLLFNDPLYYNHVLEAFRRYPENRTRIGDRTYDFNFCKVAMLTGIKYPTGGYVEFEFEPNTFSEFGALGWQQAVPPGVGGGTLSNEYRFIPTYQEYHNGSKISLEVKDQNSPQAIAIRQFNIEEKCTVEITAVLSRGNHTWQYLDQLGHFVYIKRINGTQKTILKEIKTPATGASAERSITAHIELEPGTYELVADISDALGNLLSGNYYYYSTALKATISYPKPKSSFPKFSTGCGIRIKNISHFEKKGNTTPIATTSYDYTNPLTNNSSGMLHDVLNYLDIIKGLYYTEIASPSGATTSTALFYSPYVVSLYSNNTVSNPYGSSSGVGYTYVKEIRKGQGQDNIGCTISKFKNEAGYYRYRQGGVKIDKPLNGKLEERSVYDEKGTLLEKSKYNYIATPSNSYWSITFKDTNKLTDIDGLILLEHEWGVYYGLQKPVHGSLNTGDRVLIYKTEIKSYDIILASKETLSDGVTTEEEYTYNTKTLQLRERKIKTSTFGEMRYNYIYPNDLNCGIYKTMADKNIISKAIEEKIFREIGYIGGKLTEFGYNDNQNIIVPKKIYFSEVNSILANPSTFSCNSINENIFPYPNVVYHDYDNLGNPVYITKDDAMKVVYLWGYGGQYPIAEIKNATYDNIKNLLGETFIKRVTEAIIPSETDLKTINDLRKNTTTLKDAQITTYTYKPLVGVLTITDPSGVLVKYEYDDFGRLIRTKDTDGKTIEEYNYHYKN
ncbi:MAG: RHS repeat domain-containing protein [Dysgonomonas sp.]|nr:RHS repeat domain-containing protein [Dysgonomonas sp.]